MPPELRIAKRAGLFRSLGPQYWSEGFARAAYFVPVRNGIGVWPISEIVPAPASPPAPSVTNTSKTQKILNKNLTIGP